MTPALDHIEVSRTGGGDIALDDPRWATAAALDLVLVENGQAPEFPTCVRLLYTPEQLLVRFECTADAVTATMTRYKDKVWQEDVAEVFIWPPGDEYLYEFQLSPRAVHRDLRVAAHGTADQTFDDSWGCERLHTETAINYADGRVRRWYALFGFPVGLLGEPASTEAPLIGLFRISRNPIEEFSSLRPSPDSQANFHDNRLLVPLTR
jgi:hypothetical protein